MLWVNLLSCDVNNASQNTESSGWKFCQILSDWKFLFFRLHLLKLSKSQTLLLNFNHPFTSAFLGNCTCNVTNIQCENIQLCLLNNNEIMLLNPRGFKLQRVLKVTTTMTVHLYESYWMQLQCNCFEQNYPPFYNNKLHESNAQEWSMFCVFPRINCFNALSTQCPFGGYKMSGNGRELWVWLGCVPTEYF